MTTYVKMMSDEDMADSSPYKKYTLYTLADGDTLRFSDAERVDKDELVEVVRIERRNGEVETVTMTGNVYVMNADGKTICHRGTRNDPNTISPPKR